MLGATEPTCRTRAGVEASPVRASDWSATGHPTNAATTTGT